MCLVFAKILGLPHSHITADAEPYTVSGFTCFCSLRLGLMGAWYKGEAATTRPRDCRLYTHETEDLMEGYGGLGWTPFEEWWEKQLQGSQ